MDLLSRVPNVDLHPETWNGIVKCWIQPQSVARAWYGILILRVKHRNVTKCPKTWGGEDMCVVSCLAAENRLQ